MSGGFIKDIDRSCFLVYKLDMILVVCCEGGKLPLKNN